MLFILDVPLKPHEEQTSEFYIRMTRAIERIVQKQIPDATVIIPWEDVYPLDRIIRKDNERLQSRR